VTTQTVQSASPVVMPRVNLMPPEIAQAQRLHQLQRGMVGAVVVSAVIVGGLYWHAKSGMASAQNELTAAQAQNSTLQGKYNSLAYVESDFAQAQAKAQMLNAAMGQEIRWSFVLNDLSTSLPNNVWLTGLSATETAAPGSVSVPAVPTDGSAAGIGSVTFSGIAFHHDDVANWLESMARVKGFTDPSFQSSTKIAIGTRPAVSFGTTATVGTKALSNRFTPKVGS
jgi:Tfp pilus assembly protein PilN